MIFGIDLDTTNSLARQESFDPALPCAAIEKFSWEDRTHPLQLDCTFHLQALIGRARTRRLRMTDDLNKDEFSSVSAAKVYFLRPVPRAAYRIEYPSLFNLYWQARLTESTVAQRAEALLL